MLLLVPAMAQRPPLMLSNDKINVEILPTGATIASIVLNDDPAKLNPLWKPGPQSGRGHFLCLDAFGPVSPEEQAAGLTFHGEAVKRTFETQGNSTSNSVQLSTTLPLLQENVKRSYHVVDGESVLYVETEVESQVAFDRPLVWAEHGTIGAPFLERGKTVVDMPAMKAQTRPYPQGNNTQRRLTSGKDFTWPMAPLRDGTLVDLRAAPPNPATIDHTTQLVDPTRKWGWVTAVNTDKRLIVGWLFVREDFPWLQNWENYPADSQKLARGVEFSTQPYDVPRRQTVDMGRMFDTPTFRWLPAKSKVQSRFLLFYTHTPDGFNKVDDVTFENGVITITNRASGQTIKLAASRRL
jgi:hypothetical protein